MQNQTTWSTQSEELPNTNPLLSETLGQMMRARRRALGLNQIALGYRANLDNTVVSRIETGRLLPTRADFDRLTIALALSPEDKERWAFALQQDVLTRKTVIPDTYLRPDELVSLASAHVDTVRQLRLDGKPQLAATEAARYAQWVRVLVGRCRTDRLRNLLLNSLSHLLMEQSKSYMDYVLPEEAWAYTRDLIVEQQTIASLTQDTKLSLLVGISSEATLYVSGLHKEADRVCARVLVRRHLLDIEWQQEILRAGAINAGYLANATALAEIARSIERILVESNGGDPMAFNFLLEGLARGQGMLHQGTALETIERASTLLETNRLQSHYSSLRKVQLIRTHLRVLQELGTINPVEFERIGNRGLLLADELGYWRYSQEISSIMNQVLN